MTKTQKKTVQSKDLDNLRRRVAELELDTDALRDEITKYILAAEKTAIFRKFAETSGQGFGMGQLDGRITWSNAALARILGHKTPEDVVGTLIPAYYLDEDREILVNEILPKVIDEGKATVDMPLVSIDGHPTPCSQAIFLIRDQNDDPLYFANVLTDVSERKKAEEKLRQAYDKLEERVEERTAELRLEIAERERTAEALRESEENLSITLNSIGDAVIATDADGNVTRMNSVAEKLTGWPAADALTRSLDDVFHIVNAETGEHIEKPAENILQKGDFNGLAGDTVLISRNSTERKISCSGAPIRDKDGQVFGLVLVFRDITEEQALLEQLRQSQKMEAIGQLAGGVAHDFNNLLTSIWGNAQLLIEDVEQGSPEADCTAEIIHASTRAADLTEQLLAFSRKGQLQSVDVDMHQIIEKVVGLLSRSIDKSINIVQNLMALRSIVYGDPAQLENALLNLGVNSRDAMPNGGELVFTTRNIDLDDEYCRRHPFEASPGEYVEINVTDTGCGIKHEFLKRIFEPFFTTKKPGYGTGLGLAGVYGCVKSHEGTINVRSEPDKGCNFRVLLPVTETISPSVPNILKGDLVRGEGHILVVDDEETVRTFIAKALRGLGYTVSLCVDGLEAVDVFQAQHASIDLVILDMVMPRLGGEHAFRRMTRIDPTVPVLITSGFSHTRAINSVLDKGAAGFVKKPFRIEEVSQQIANSIKAR